MAFRAVHEQWGTVFAHMSDLGCGRAWEDVHRVRPPAPLQCDECRHPLRAKVSPTGLRFFAHAPGAPKCASAGESMAHHLLKLELSTAARTAGAHVELEVRGPEGAWRADVMASDPGGSWRIALEAQLSPITPAEIQARMARMLEDGVRMVWLAEPPPQETVDPAALAQRAVDSMTLLGPDIASPRAAGKYTVGVPMWMWVNQSATTYGPNTASASAGGITVTATAKVSKIVWKMGDGASVTCNGSGTPYTSSEGMAESPTCGHVYSRTSASTQSSKFPVTATSTWTINWQGGGQAGQLTEVRQTNVQVAVGEVQVVR